MITILSRRMSAPNLKITLWDLRIEYVRGFDSHILNFYFFLPVRLYGKLKHTTNHIWEDCTSFHTAIAQRSWGMFGGHLPSQSPKNTRKKGTHFYYSPVLLASLVHTRGVVKSVCTHYHYSVLVSVYYMWLCMAWV